MICTNPSPEHNICNPDAGCSPLCCNDCTNRNGTEYYEKCTGKCDCADPENNPCQWQLSYEQILGLQRHKTYTVGLWATDKPEKLSKEEQEKCHLFEIKCGPKSLGKVFREA